MPGKWERRWRERFRRRLELVQVEVADQERAIRDGAVDMCFVRGEPDVDLDREGLHYVALYREVPVVVASREHPVAAYDEIGTADLAGEYRHPVPEVPVRDAVEAVAAGTGIVVLPMSLARLHHRRDVVAVPLTDGEESQVGLAWLVESDNADIQAFVGVVRGRTSRSSRTT